MRRLTPFLLGFILGGATVYVSLHFHLIRAESGLHMVPKLQSTFGQTYVDVRGFGVNQWNEHHMLAAAVTRAGRTELFRGAVIKPMNSAVDDFFNTLKTGGS